MLVSVWFLVFREVREESGLGRDDGTMGGTNIAKADVFDHLGVEV